MEKPDSDSAESRSSPTRRTVLREGVAALGTTVAVSGVASASGAKKTLYERYSDPETAERAIKKFADDIVPRLREVNTEYVAPTSELSVKRVVNESLARERPQEGTYVGTVEQGGQHTAHLTVVRTSGTTVVRLVVEPETGRAYAFLRHRNGDLIDVVTAESASVSTTVAGDDVTTTGCTSEIICDSCCGLCGNTLGIEYEKICCDDDFPGGCYRDQLGGCCSLLKD